MTFRPASRMAPRRERLGMPNQYVHTYYVSRGAAVDLSRYSREPANVLRNARLGQGASSGPNWLSRRILGRRDAHRNVDAHQVLDAARCRFDPAGGHIDQGTTDRPRSRWHEDAQILILADADRLGGGQQGQHRPSRLAAEEAPDGAHAGEAVVAFQVDDRGEALA